MRFLLVFFVLFAVSIYSNAAQHSINPTLLGYLDQDNDPGLAIFYHSPLTDSVELELGYLDSGELEVTEDQDSHFGQYESVLLGTSLLKQYNKQLQLKAGAGVNWPLHSSNQHLIKADSVNPYLKFSARYAINRHFSLEVGQLSQLSSGQLDLHQSLFFGVNYTFGNTPNQVAGGKQSENGARPNQLELSKQITNKAAEQAKVTKKIAKPAEKDATPYWTVQVGAFSSLTNADSFIGEIPQQAKTLRNSNFRTIERNGNYLVITGNFVNYSGAKALQEILEKTFRLKGFSKFISPDN